MGRHAVMLVILLCYHLLFVGIVQTTQSISKEDDLDMEIHLKSIKAKQVISAPVYNKASGIESSIISNSFDLFSKSEKCPIGTTSIRRIPKADLIRERKISKAKKTETKNRSNTYLAIARTKIGPLKYSGAGSFIKTDNPKVVGQQFSATRMRLQAGTDSIEVGWRVDPSLYGDSRTRLFIRTDADHTHCFNNLCPGFIQTFHGFNFDAPFENISIPGGLVKAERCYIIKDKGNGNWNLFLGENSTLIGYWPSRIFTRLKGLADRVEWGGVAYSPPGMPLPPMGSGNHPIGNPRWDGLVLRMKVLNERGQTFDASDLETYVDDSKLYSVLDIGYHGSYWGHVIFYGGSGHQ